MKGLLVFPVLVPLSAAALLLFFQRRRRAQETISVLASAATVLSSWVIVTKVTKFGTLTSQIGAWPAPFGISFVADRLGAMMALVAGILIWACVVYSLMEGHSKRVLFGFYPLLLILLAGANGAFLTGDLFNLYVWFEVLLIGSFALLVLGNTRAQLRGAIPNVAMSLVASALLLSAVGVIYGMTGTLNMAELSRRLSGLALARAFMPAGVFFLTALGIKAAVFPMFFWLPKAYPTVPVAVTAAFSGIITKVAVYAMLRFVTLFMGSGIESIRQPLLAIAAITMVTGVLGAAAQNELRRILSFHIISQIGYMIMGLALFTPLSIAGAIYFIIHNIFAKSNLFLISGVAERIGGSFELKSLGGFYRASPHLSLLFIVSAFSLAGLPPLSGFWGKFLLARAGFEAREYLIVGVSLAVGLLTLFSMTKIWLQVFWKPFPIEAGGDPIEPRISGKSALVLAPVAALASLTIAMGLLVEPVVRYLSIAANDLLDPAQYITSVLGQGGLSE